MADNVPCPGCKSDLTLHCDPKDCGWVICRTCSVVYGATRSMPLYSSTKKKKA